MGTLMSGPFAACWMPYANDDHAATWGAGVSGLWPHRHAQRHGDARHAGAADAGPRSILRCGIRISWTQRWADQAALARRRRDVPVHQPVGTRALHLADVG